MKTRSCIYAAVFLGLLTTSAAPQDGRMDWWRDARFGLFIHWGLYAVPAGEWKDDTHHGEWIMTTAKIPVPTYEKFLTRFNPVKFDAEAWVKVAKAAGMKYIVITSKHHDGFALYDSKVSDYDVMATPFKRDILKELQIACEKQGVRLCFYHSIMDWHHPDYLPRRGWEKRSAEGADLDRYVGYMKEQVKELLTGYGDIGVMWFDGEWESTWTHEYGKDLYDFCRRLKPNVIVNNRVDKGRRGMSGLTIDDRYRGDFGTPEQEIPPTGLPDVDWETCMTMNGHWGFNKHDDRWKSNEDLIHKLVDIASKGGNFLLNVGPTGEGTFPEPCIERLLAMGEWMKVNGDAIYGTKASPFDTLPWGRCTAKTMPDGTHRLYLHVFDPPKDGRLRLPGLRQVPVSMRMLERAPTDRGLSCARSAADVVIWAMGAWPDPIASVIELKFTEKPVVVGPPEVDVEFDVFVDAMTVRFKAPPADLALRYTLDGSEPTATSPRYGDPIRIDRTTTVTARLFEGREPASAAATHTFRALESIAASKATDVRPGLRWSYYEGNWRKLPDFTAEKAVATGAAEKIDLAPAKRKEYFALRFVGYVRVPERGVYRFTTQSDDGSALAVAGKHIVDNDGLHGPESASGVIALEAGLHPITVTFFQRTGGRQLDAYVEGPSGGRKPLDGIVFHAP